MRDVSLSGLTRVCEFVGTGSCGVDVFGHDGILQGYETYTYSTKDGSRQVTISANASNNANVFTTLHDALTPVFCGTSAAVQE